MIGAVVKNCAGAAQFAASLAAVVGLIWSASSLANALEANRNNAVILECSKMIAALNDYDAKLTLIELAAELEQGKIAADPNYFSLKAAEVDHLAPVLEVQAQLSSALNMAHVLFPGDLEIKMSFSFFSPYVAFLEHASSGELVFVNSERALKKTQQVRDATLAEKKKVSVHRSEISRLCAEKIHGENDAA
ncbi:hypothetical protein LKK83_27015 [Phormidium sp. CCY1219]|nr:hypothetical protein [Phormidium sp. CCY1219]MEB3831132.1 hypothetical protein [Phormidium sp. CCY1219]